MRIATKLKLEIKVLGRNGGSGQTCGMDVSYDSGCQSMAFPYSEAEPMLTQAAASNLHPVASLLCIYGSVCGQSLDADYYSISDNAMFCCEPVGEPF